jgi:hypothetical protein
MRVRGKYRQGGSFAGLYAEDRQAPNAWGRLMRIFGGKGPSADHARLALTLHLR